MVTRQALVPVTDDVPIRPRAPGTLRLVQEFVNTHDLETGSDELADADALRSWLRARGMLQGGTAVRVADVARAVALREALRALLLANNGERDDPRASEVLDRIAARARLAPRFVGPRSYRLEVGAAGVDGAVGRIVAAVAEAMDAGTWERLKACRNDACQWAFYDASRNRSGAWCRMAVCGNRMKVRAFRRRQRAASARPPDRG